MSTDRPIEKRRPPKLSLGWIGLVALLLIAVIWWNWPARSIPFDPAIWKSAKDAPGYEERFAMIKELQRGFDAGKYTTQADVLALLGPPETGAVEGRFYRYNLGREHRGVFRVDNDWLDLEFDDVGKLRNHRVRPD